MRLSKRRARRASGFTASSGRSLLLSLLAEFPTDCDSARYRFGWEDPNIWKKRRDLLIKTIKTNPKAPYVYRNIAVGSEPLYDWALDPNELANQVYGVRASLAQFGIQTSELVKSSASSSADLLFSTAISEMPYGYQIHNGAQQVLDSLDFVESKFALLLGGPTSTLSEVLRAQGRVEARHHAILYLHVARRSSIASLASCPSRHRASARPPSANLVFFYSHSQHPPVLRRQGDEWRKRLGHGQLVTRLLPPTRARQADRHDPDWVAIECERMESQQQLRRRCRMVGEGLL